jgi:exosortase/archaeosortase family protein
MFDKKHRSFVSYLVKFLVIFILLNYGTFYFIGLATPGGYYLEFLDRYFDYPEGLLKSLLWGCQLLYSIFGISTFVANYDQLWIRGGAGVQVAYDCLGYGVMSFWAAYVLANTAPFLKKMKWLAGGWLLLWLINVSRISLFLKSVNEKWGMPFGVDHHTWFNIISYLCIFLMIFAHEKSLDPSEKNLVESADLNSNPDLTNRDL